MNEKALALLRSPEGLAAWRRIRQEEWYTTLMDANHPGVKKLAQTLLLGAIMDDLAIDDKNRATYWPALKKVDSIRASVEKRQRRENRFKPVPEGVIATCRKRGLELIPLYENGQFIGYREEKIDEAQSR